MTILRSTLISCDESGFTGNRLLDNQQPYFSYASTDLSLSEAETIIAEVRARYRLQANELKTANLLRRDNGRRAICDILEQMDGRYILTLYDKRLSLCGKFFEYIYEPVLQKNNILFYNNNLHRFVAMLFYTILPTITKTTEVIAEQFEAFMRSFDPASAPVLFEAHGRPIDDLMDTVLRFARGYRDKIFEETRTLQITGDTGKWVLDLSISALWSHLATWGERHELIEVTCDASKPLAALTPELIVMINRPERVIMHEFGKRRPLTWNMSRPITFADSRVHAGVQLADIVAGAVGFIARQRRVESAKALVEYLDPHLHDDCIMPDYDLLDLNSEETLVNCLVLYELARRADVGADPLEGMDFYYAYVRANLSHFHYYDD